MSSGKAILIVVNYFFPYVSGVSEYARIVAKALAPLHRVTVLTGRHLKSLPVNEEIDGYRVIRANPLLFISKGYVSVDFLRTFRRLARESDLVNIHFPMLESGLLVRLTSRPVVLTYQCDMALEGNWLNRLAVLAVRASGKAALSRASRIVVLSNDYARSSAVLNAFLDKTIEVLPPNRFESFDLDARAANQASTERNSNFICGFVGRFVHEKGIDTIIGAIERLKNSPIEFWLAGNYTSVAGGTIFRQFEDKLASFGSRVRVLGHLSDEDLVNFYSKVDVLLLPSINRFEAFGMVQIEAMAFGAMVIASDMPGVREVVRRTGMGELCIAGSDQSLAEAILKVFAHRDQISRSKIRAKLHEHFSHNLFTRSYLELIDTI